MSINIKVCESMISIKRNGISLADFQIEQKENKNLKKNLSKDKLEVAAKKSSEKVDEKKKRKSGCKQRKDIVKKKERSRHKLTKLEKRYKYLENICYEYISPNDNQNKSLLETNDSKSTKRSVSTLLELTQQVLQLEHEVNAILVSGQSNDYNCNSTSGYEITDFLLKLNKVKKRLVDEFDLNLSSQMFTDDSRNLENRSEIDNSTVNSEFQKSCSSFSNDVCGGDIGRTTTTIPASSRLDEHEQMIDNLTGEILMDLKNFSSSISSSSVVHYTDECIQNKSWCSDPVLADLPKVLPSYSRNSLLHRAKPPANLICNNFKRLDIDFTIHELSAIYETDSEFSCSQTAIQNLK